MEDRAYTIQELVDLSGVPRRNIYFYAQQGILPPPQGAGLAARYGLVHLLRLRAIPHLRQQGLRLDEIRQRLAGLDETGLSFLLAPQTGPVVSAPKAPPAPAVVEEPPSAASLPHPVPSFLHYPLPGGITLVVPAGLSVEEKRRVDLLLETASRILAQSHPGDPEIQRVFC